MKTAFKLLLLSACFLSVNAFAKGVWKEQPRRIPTGGEDKPVITHLAVSSDGLTIFLTERLHLNGTPYLEQLWKSTDGGVTWFVLEYAK
jgi:hypothetical protein